MDKTFTPEMITPQWVLILCVAGLLILFGSRRHVLPTFLVVATLLCLQNRVYIFGLNFFTSRILLVLGWTRVFARGEHRDLRLLPLDKAWLIFCLWSLLSETLRRGMPGAVFGAANYLFDCLGTYFLVRILLRDAQGFFDLLKTGAVICCFFALFMTAEFVTGHNWMTFLGAVFETVQERAGRTRSQATFLHPVLAGTYGAVLLPLFAACWWHPRMKKLAVVGCIAAVVMVVTAGSGGPVMTFAAVLGGLCLWPLRRNLRPLRWALLLTLIAFHLVMKAPVWALIARFQVVQGASAYHRYELLDAFIRHFSDWWLVGTTDTESWGWLTDDVANYFCVVAKHAGLLGLLLFIRVLVLGFRQVGLCRKEAESDRRTEILIWAFGISLFGHAVSFFGISYFDQTIVLWHFTLAILASLSLLTQAQTPPVEVEVVPAEEGIPLTKALPVD